MRRRIVLFSLLGSVALGMVGVGGPTTYAASPGGSGLIAFSTGFDGSFSSSTSQIFTVLPNGSGLQQLTHVATGQHALSPGFSSNGTRIAFQSDATGNFEIWAMSSAGGGQAQLTNDPTFQNFHPRWSPDGTRIVFTRCTFSFGAPVCHIAVMNADGTGISELTSGHWADGDACGSSPAFGTGLPAGGAEYSPDGSQIAFDSNRGGFESAVWVMNANGSGLKRLTAARLEAVSPDWSPDGTHLAFMTNGCRPLRVNVWVMGADGSGAHALTNLPHDHNALFEAYSPDGRQIVLVSDLRYSNRCCDDLYVMNTNGSGLHSILTTQPTVLLTDWGPAG
jgi:TolB protein